MSYVATEEAYLCHHGVKGMKWGVRKDRSTGGGRKSSGKQDGIIKSHVKKQLRKEKEFLEKPVKEQLKTRGKQYLSAATIAFGAKTAHTILKNYGKRDAADLMGAIGEGMATGAKRNLKIGLAVTAGYQGYKLGKKLYTESKRADEIIRSYDSPGDAKARKIAGDFGVGVKRGAEALGGKVQNYGKALSNTSQERIKNNEGYQKRNIERLLGPKSSEEDDFNDYIDRSMTNAKNKTLVRNEYNRLEQERKTQANRKLDENRRRNLAKRR